MDVLRYAEGLANALHYIHHVAVPDAIVIHRDLKPDNIMIGGNEDTNTIYLIDFGLSTFYKKDGAHIPKTRASGFNGNLMFASITSCSGYVNSRRDDF